MPLDALAAAPGGLDEFRITAPREIVVRLKELYDANAQLNLNASDGSVVRATVWAMDTDRGSLSLAIDATDPALPALLECSEIVVVGYLDSVKLQFDLHDAVLVRGAQASVLSCAFPREVFRFQRRGAFRVRPAHRSTPMARLRHSEIAEMQLALRVLDVSIGGCALFLPDDVPALQPGGIFNQVQIELDADTRFHVNLRLQHVTSLGPDSHGVRLGCEFVRADSGALRTLQRFIDQTQKRGKLLSLA
ncbi:MAG TPA: flagellar regulator YcgR PilZN domain-containing protein [Burkholderiaceae bacterium]